MKENIKKILLIVSMFYSVIVIVLMLFNMSNMVTSVDLHDTEDNKTKIKQYKNELSLLEKNNCTNVINEMIEYYEKTSYSGKVDLKKMYEDNYSKSFLSFYMDVRNECSLSDSFAQENKLPTKFLTEMMHREELYQRYLFQYEINIKDTFMRNIAAADITNIEYRISKDTELEIISILIDSLNKGGITNE